MNIEEIKKINDLTGQIVRLEDSIKSIKWRLTQLQSTGQCFTAKMELKLGGPRFEYSPYMNKEEVIMVLERKLQENELALEKLKKEYEAIS